MRLNTAALLVAYTICFSAQLSHGAEPQRVPWGEISELGQGRFQFRITNPPQDGLLPLPEGFPHVLACGVNSDPPRFVPVAFDPKGTVVSVDIASHSVAGAIAMVQTAEASQQFDDGRIVFSARDAQVHGTHAKLESNPGNHRIGYWTSPQDFVSWDYKASRWGMYRILLTYSSAGSDGTEIEVELTDKPDQPIKQSATLASTGSWYRYTTLDLGTHYVSTAGPKTLTVRCTQLKGAAVMNLKSVLLIPACEGKPPVPAADDSITLHARDSTVHGTMLRWEPAEAKQTLGYWIRPSDYASWEVTLEQPGTFDVDVWQGCGTGQGGSTMRIGTVSQPIEWTVEETGHFQNFKQRTIGRLTFDQPGTYVIEAGPVKIANKAACDIRQIQLRPAPPAN